MRYIFFIFLFILSLRSSGQGPAVQDSTETYVRNIRAEYQKINSSRLRVVDAEPQEESSEGGEVKKYYDGKDLGKIVTDYMGAIGRSVREYYFSGEGLCFVYTVEYTYDRPMSGHVIKKVENRYYFHHRRLIRWIDNKGKIKDKSLYADKGREILSDRDLR